MYALKLDKQKDYFTLLLEFIQGCLVFNSSTIIRVCPVDWVLCFSHQKIIQKTNKQTNPKGWIP